MLGEIALFNDYYKSLSVRIYESGKRELIISSRIEGTWQERTLEENKLKSLLIILDDSLSFDEIKKQVEGLIGNPNNYCTDFTQHYGER